MTIRSIYVLTSSIFHLIFWSITIDSLPSQNSHSFSFRISHQLTVFPSLTDFQRNVLESLIFIWKAVDSRISISTLKSALGKFQPIHMGVGWLCLNEKLDPPALRLYQQAAWNPVCCFIRGSFPARWFMCLLLKEWTPQWSPHLCITCDLRGVRPDQLSPARLGPAAALTEWEPQPPLLPSGFQEFLQGTALWRFLFKTHLHRVWQHPSQDCYNSRAHIY